MRYDCCRCGGYGGEYLSDGWMPCYHCCETGKCEHETPMVYPMIPDYGDPRADPDYDYDPREEKLDET